MLASEQCPRQSRALRCARIALAWCLLSADPAVDLAEQTGYGCLVSPKAGLVPPPSTVLLISLGRLIVQSTLSLVEPSAATARSRLSIMHLTLPGLPSRLQVYSAAMLYGGDTDGYRYRRERGGRNGLWRSRRRVKQRLGLCATCSVQMICARGTS